MTPEALQAVLAGQGVPPGQDGRSSTPTLDQYGRDLTAMAREGRIDPVIGRDGEIEQTIEVLSRRGKNNPVLIGEAGVGKTAIVEGLAQRIVNEDVPQTLAGKRVVQLELSGVVAGTRYRGDFEERLRSIIDEIREHSDELIIFIDELHTIVGAGAGAEGGMDAGNMVKPALARGELHVVGATTLDEYRKNIEKDAALARRFQPILVPEPTVDDALAILQGLRDRYEAHHQVRYDDEALVAAVELSDRYVTDRFLPDKAIDLIDQAGARVRLRTKTPDADLRDLERRADELQAGQGSGGRQRELRAGVAGCATRSRTSAGRSTSSASEVRPCLRSRSTTSPRWCHGPLASRSSSSPRRRRIACSAWSGTCTSAWSGRTRRSRRSPRQCAGPAPGSATRTARSAASCSSGRPASARPS